VEIRRVFVDKLDMQDGMVLVAGPARKYIVNVLRKDRGQRVDLIDGKGYLYRCMIDNIQKTELQLQILDAVHHPEEEGSKVTLCASPIKGPRMDWLIEKATELGVERILPTVFRRTVVRCEEREGGKHERWRKLAIEASRQSGRTSVPEVVHPIPLGHILPYLENIQNRWVLYEKEKDSPLREAISSQREGGIAIVVGPEGGIDESEIEWLRKNHFVPITLGENIFRAETVPLVIMSIISYERGKK
jgi:16S rRNA (uracil1498-N3)-methyltransferase